MTIHPAKLLAIVIVSAGIGFVLHAAAGDWLDRLLMQMNGGG